MRPQTNNALRARTDVLTEEELLEGVLVFRGASFAFVRTLPGPGEPLAVFDRRETEGKAKLRPKVIHRWLVVPLSWVLRGRGGEEFLLARGGRRPAPGLLPVIASPEETPALPPEEFEEQGLPFHTLHLPSEQELYLPEPFHTAGKVEEVLRALGLPALPQEVKGR